MIGGFCLEVAVLGESVLKTKSFAFALRIVEITRELAEQKSEYVVSRQVLKSGTSIGANIEEANQAESTSDFIHKLSIANKEAFETHYWLRLMRDSGLIDADRANDLIANCQELQKMLTASIKTSKSREK